jgi:potassium-dependent mechanosensitive channel
MTLLLLGLLACAVPGAGAQQPAAPAAAPPVPSLLELAGRYPLVADSALQAERAVAQLRNTQPMEVELAVARERHAELASFLGAVAGAEYLRPERISRVRDQALLQTQRLEALNARVTPRLDVLAQLRIEWTLRQRTWAAWRDSLRADPDFELVAPDIERAIARMDSVRARVDEAVPPLVELQREISALHGATVEIGSRMAALREGRRAELQRRSEPTLFSAAFAEQMRGTTLDAWEIGAAFATDAYVAFIRDEGALLLLHVVLVLLLTVLAGRLKRHAAPEAGWSGLLDHPLALCVFATTALLSPRYTLGPPLWDVLMWTLLAVSGAILATRLLRDRPLRWLVYYFAAAYPLLLLAEALRAPLPAFRIGLTAVALGGAVLFGNPAFWRGHAETRSGVGRWIVGLAALLWGVVLVAEVIGFHPLARWIVHATVTSALFVFVVVLLIVTARGAVQTMLRVESAGRLHFLRSIAVPLAERLLLLLQVFLILGATLNVLDVWELAPSPAETWSRIIGAGFIVAGVQVTVGRVLLAMVILYVASVVSSLTRVFVDAEATSRWRIDRAVGNSISTLVHYALITFGLLFALGALGVQLQNFAIVAGALGIGIGFGLQNVVNNFVSGLILLFERPVRVGDTVVLGTEWGTVKKIGLRSTIVVTFDRSELIVPNADLVSERVTNWTLSDPMARLTIPVGVAYGSNVARVLEILREAGNAHPAVLDDPPPQALFMEFGDSALEFELRVWVQELRYRLEVKSAVLARMDALLRDAGIEIPFPQRDLHLRSVDAGVIDSMLRRPSADAGT